MRTEDGYIIHKCLNGEPEAFGFLVDKYKAAIYAFAYSKLYNFHDTEDVTQEAFIKAYQKLHTLKRSDSFLAWLYSITSNLCKMWLRSHSNRPDREFIADQEPRFFDHSSVSSYRERQVCELIREALESLPEIYREVLTLYYLGGLSCREIARFLGASPNTIEQRLSRARAKLREETLIMMSATYDQVKLQPSFTFRIVELVKRINVQPWTRAPWLPWGLSFVTGIVLTVLGFITYPTWLNPSAELSGSEDSIEAKVLEIGEVPVDVVKVSEVPIIDSGRGVQLNAPTNLPSLRDAFAFLFAPQVGEEKWTKKAEMPTARFALSTGMVNGKIYAISGLANKDGRVVILPTVEEYDPTTDKWTRKADMPIARFAPNSTSVVNGKIYVISGATGPFGPVVSTVEEYDPATDTWTKKADIPTRRYLSSTSVANGKIYAIGGVPNGGPAFPSVEEYNPVTDTWTKKADMPTARHNFSTSVVNGKIYAIGGAISRGVPPVPAVEEYNPATDTWTKKADMPIPRWGLSTSVVDEKIYAIGGVAGYPGPTVSTVEKYDPATDTWTKKADMLTKRFFHSTSEVNGKIYAIGGAKDLPANQNLTQGLSTVEELDIGFDVEAKGKQATSWGKMKK